MAIELPDLVQRIRVKTDEVRAAAKPTKALAGHLDDLRDSSSDASDSMDELADSTDRYNTSAGKSGRVTDDAVARMKALSQSSDDASSSIRTTADDTGRLRTAVAGAADDVEHLGTTTDHTSDSTSRLGTETERAAKSQTTFQRNTRKSDLTLGSMIKRALVAVATIAALKIALLGLAVPGAIAQLGDLLSAAAAGAIALTSATAPLAGALAAIPAGIIALGSVAGVFKAVTAGIGPAVKAVQTYGRGSKEARDALSKLDASQQAFALNLNSTLNTLKRVGATIRSTALPGFADALDRAQKFLPSLTNQFSKLGSVVGGFVDDFAKLVTSGPFSKDIQTILSRNNKLVGTLGKAFLQVFSAIRHVVVAAGPMVQTFADLVLTGSKYLNVAARTNRANGDLASFFKETVSVMKTWLHIIGDVAVGLFNIFKIGKSLGDDMLKTLRGNARAFRDFTESGKGKNRIKAFFDDARPVLRQFGKLVTALGKAFFNITDKVDTGPLLRQLRTELLPVLEKLLKRTGKSGLTSSIIDLAVAFGKLLNALPINALSQLIQATAKVATAFVKLGKTHPIILQVVAALLSMKLAMTAISGVSKFVGITALSNALHAIGPAGDAGLTGIKGFIQGFRGAEGKSRTLANKFGDGLYRGIAGGVNKVKGLFTKSNSIEGAVSKSLKPGGIKAKATKFGSTITKGISDGLKGIKRVGADVSSSVAKSLGKEGAVGKAARSLGTNIKTGITKSLSGIGTVASKALSGLKTGLLAIGSASKTAVLGMAGFVKTAALATASAAKSTAVFVAQKVALLATAVAEGVVKAATVAWTAVQWLLDAALTANPIGLVVVAIGALVAGLILAWKNSDTFRKIVTAAFQAISKVVTTVVGFVVDFVKNHWQLLIAIIGGPLGIIVALVIKNWDRIKAVISTAVKVISSIIHKYVAIWKAIIVGAFNAIRTYFKFVWGVYKAIFHAAIAAIIGVVKLGMRLIHDYIVTPFTTVVRFFKELFGNVVSGIRDRIGDVLGFFRGLPGKIAGAFKDPLGTLHDIGGLIMQGLINGIKDKTPDLINELGIIGRLIQLAKGPPAKDKVLLFNAGQLIMGGLINGIKDSVPGLRGLLGAISDFIPDWKGPIGKDEVLLYPAGRAIMRGLTKGIREGAPDVQKALGDVTDSIHKGMIQVEDGSFVSPSFFGGPNTELVKQIGGAIAEAARTFFDKGLPEDPATRKLKKTSLSAEVQKRIEKKAQDAAEKENRLRAKLPLLSGADKREVRDRIRELQKEQQRLTRRATALTPVSDLRKERQQALRAADLDAKKARQLRETLPGLEGKDKRKAKAEIDRLDQDRKDELKKARDIQSQLIKAFNDLPPAVQKLIKKLQEQRQERAEKQRQRERRQERQDNKGTGTGTKGTGTGGLGGAGGGFGGVPLGAHGTFGDPFHTHQDNDPGKTAGLRIGHALNNILGEAHHLGARVGKDLPTLTDVTGRVGHNIVGAVQDSSAKNARTVGGEIKRAGRGRDKAEQETKNAVNKASEASNLHFDRTANQARVQSERAGQQERRLAADAKGYAAQNAKSIATETRKAAAAADRVKGAVDKATEATHHEMSRNTTRTGVEANAGRVLDRRIAQAQRLLLNNIAVDQKNNDLINTTALVSAITSAAIATGVNDLLDLLDQGSNGGGGGGNKGNNKKGNKGNNKGANAQGDTDTSARTVTPTVHKTVVFNNSQFETGVTEDSIIRKLRTADVVGRDESGRFR